MCYYLGQIFEDVFPLVAGKWLFYRRLLHETLIVGFDESILTHKGNSKTKSGSLNYQCKRYAYKSFGKKHTVKLFQVPFPNQ